MTARFHTTQKGGAKKWSARIVQPQFPHVPELHEAPATRSHVRALAYGQAGTFTRLDTAAERDTYPMLTPAAAEGILRAVYWHPQMNYRILRIDVLSRVNIYAQRVNELSRHAPANGLNISEMENRAMRLRRVIDKPAYAIYADVVLHPAFRDGENLGKVTGIINRRLQRGQTYQRPYFGIREFPATVLPIGPQLHDEPTPIPEDAELGPVPLFYQRLEDPNGPLTQADFQWDYAEQTWLRRTKRIREAPVLFDAVVRSGTLMIPPYRTNSLDGGW